jgi:hypothetical protein
MPTKTVGTYAPPARRDNWDADTESSVCGTPAKWRTDFHAERLLSGTRGARLT